MWRKIDRLLIAIIIFLLIMSAGHSLWYRPRAEVKFLSEPVVSVDASLKYDELDLTDLSIVLEKATGHDNLVVFDGSGTSVAETNIFTSYSHGVFSKKKLSRELITDNTARILDSDLHQSFAQVFADTTYDFYIKVKKTGGLGSNRIIINGAPYRATLLSDAWYLVSHVKVSEAIVGLGVESDATILNAFLVTGTRPGATPYSRVSPNAMSGQPFERSFNIDVPRDAVALAGVPNNTEIENVESYGRQPETLFYFDDSINDWISHLDAANANRVHVITQSGLYKLNNSKDIFSKSSLAYIFLFGLASLYLLRTRGLERMVRDAKRYAEKSSRDLRKYFAKHLVGVVMMILWAILLLVLKTNMSVAQYLTSFVIIALILLPLLVYLRFSYKLLRTMSFGMLFLDFVMAHFSNVILQDKVSKFLFFCLALTMVRVSWDILCGYKTNREQSG